MANIVNTPIIMSVNEHNLSLYDGSVTELMEYNTYPIKIYTDENLDGCQLVKRLQNDQRLVSVGDLRRDIRALLRSEHNDKEEKKAWWATIENLNDENDDQIYGGTLKAYQYETILSAIPEVPLRTQCEIVELGTIKLKLGFSISGNKTTYIVADVVENPTDELEEEFQISDEVLKTSIITEDFLDIPSPLSEQYSIKTPEKVTLKNSLTLNGPVHSFDLNGNQVVINSSESLEVPFYSYDEEEGFYYYKKILDQQKLIGNTKNDSSQAISDATVEELEVDFDSEIICKIPENNFGDYYISLETSFNPKLTRGLGKEKVELEDIEITLTKSNFDLTNYTKVLKIDELTISKEKFSSISIKPLTDLKFDNIELSQQYDKEIKIEIVGGTEISTSYLVFSGTINKDFLGYKKNSDTISNKMLNIKTDLVLKIEESEFNNLFKEAGDQGKIDSLSSEPIINIQLTELHTPYLALEEEHLVYSYDARDNLTLDWGEIEFDVGSFDLDQITINDDEGSHTKVYTLYEKAEKEGEQDKIVEFITDRYNGAGLNSLLFGIRKQEEIGGKLTTTYVTNSVSLEVIPSIESDAWYTPTIEAKRAYLGIPVLGKDEKGEETEKIVDFKNSNNEFYTKEVDSIYINIDNYEFLDSNAENKTLKNLEIYSWNPANSEFQIYGGFLTPDKPEDTTPSQGAEGGSENGAENGAEGGETPSAEPQE